jgi:hypothetical protein
MVCGSEEFTNSAPASADRLFLKGKSSGEDVPPNLVFPFLRNRLNVAISRAQCFAYLVCAPRLLETRCNMIEEMELVNALAALPSTQPQLSAT